MKPRKIPLRRCMGCYESKPKKELVRIVKNKEGEIALDLTGKKAGRGAYICKDDKCLAKAQKAKRIERVLECVISEELYTQMHEEIKRAQIAE